MNTTLFLTGLAVGAYDGAWLVATIRLHSHEPAWFAAAADWWLDRFGNSVVSMLAFTHGFIALAIVLPMVSIAYVGVTLDPLL